MTEARDAQTAHALIIRNTEGMNRAAIQISRIEADIVRCMGNLAVVKGTKKYPVLKKKIETLLARRNKWVDKYTAYQNGIVSLAAVR